MSKNLYGTLIAGGVLAYLMFQVFLNIGMTIGIMPVTGVAPAAAQLRRLLGARDFPGHRPSAVDPRASARGVGRQGEGPNRMTASAASPFSLRTRPCPQADQFQRTEEN